MSSTAFVYNNKFVKLQCELIAANTYSSESDLCLILPNGIQKKVAISEPSESNLVCLELLEKIFKSFSKIQTVAQMTSKALVAQQTSVVTQATSLIGAVSKSRAQLSSLYPKLPKATSTYTATLSPAETSDANRLDTVMLFLGLLDNSVLTPPSKIKLQELINLFTPDEDGFSPFVLSNLELPPQLRFLEAIKCLLAVFIDFNDVELKALLDRYKSLGIEGLDIRFSEVMIVACDLRAFIYSSNRLFTKEEFIENASDCSIVAMHWALKNAKLSLFMRLAAFSVEEDLEFALVQFKNEPKISREDLVHLKSAILEVADVLTRRYALPERTKILKDWAIS